LSVKFEEAFCFDSFQDRLLFWDDFHGDQVQDEWRDAGTGGVAVVDQQTGGIVRITTGAVLNNAHYMDWQNYRTLHVDQRVAMEARVRPDDLTGYCMISLYHNATNYINMWENTNWFIQCYDNGAGGSFDSGIAVSTVNFQILRMECHTHGANHVHFYVDGVECANSPIGANVPDDATDFLQPYLYMQTGEALAHYLDVDYVYLRQDR